MTRSRRERLLSKIESVRFISSNLIQENHFIDGESGEKNFIRKLDTMEEIIKNCKDKIKEGGLT